MTLRIYVFLLRAEDLKITGTGPPGVPFLPARLTKDGPRGYEHVGPPVGINADAGIVPHRIRRKTEKAIISNTFSLHIFRLLME